MVQNRDIYIQKYAMLLNCEPNAYAVAAAKISQECEFISASVIALGLTARDDEQLAYARKFAEHLKEYLGENYKYVDAQWLAEYIQAYVAEVDTTYRW